MLIPQYRLLNIEDFKPEEQDLVGKLAQNLNIPIQNLYIALTNRLTFSDNFQSTQKSFTVTVDSKGNPISPTSFKINTINNTVPKAIGSIVVNAQSSVSGTYPSNGVFVSFSQNTDNITINNIAGLPAGVEFTITLIVLN